MNGSCTRESLPPVPQADIRPPVDRAVDRAQDQRLVDATPDQEVDVAVDMVIDMEVDLALDQAVDQGSLQLSDPPTVRCLLNDVDSGDPTRLLRFSATLEESFARSLVDCQGSTLWMHFQTRTGSLLLSFVQGEEEPSNPGLDLGGASPRDGGLDQGRDQGSDATVDAVVDATVDAAVDQGAIPLDPDAQRLETFIERLELAEGWRLKEGCALSAGSLGAFTEGSFWRSTQSVDMNQKKLLERFDLKGATLCEPIERQDLSGNGVYEVEGVIEQDGQLFFENYNPENGTRRLMRVERDLNPVARLEAERCGLSEVLQSARPLSWSPRPFEGQLVYLVSDPRQQLIDLVYQRAPNCDPSSALLFPLSRLTAAQPSAFAEGGWLHRLSIKGEPWFLWCGGREDCRLHAARPGGVPLPVTDRDEPSVIFTRRGRIQRAALDQLLFVDTSSSQRETLRSFYLDYDARFSDGLRFFSAPTEERAQSDHFEAAEIRAIVEPDNPAPLEPLSYGLWSTRTERRGVLSWEVYYVRL
ncbi:MAG: hypothetical protein VYD19_04760 [Myxococcota bacterium]|nr:hypothetical protein [Myxococcota bacterium]